MVNEERLRSLSKVIRKYSELFKEQTTQVLSWETLKEIADKLDEIILDGEQ